MKKFLFVFFLIGVSFAMASPIKVTLRKEGAQWKMYRDGKPFYIKGAGGQKYGDRVAAYGGNSIRTWGSENAQEILDEAQKNGITVMLGLWVQHERHGFDYNNEEKVKNQLENFRQIVLKYKDHPALLLWGVGNEVNLNYKNTKVWDATNDIAKMIHELDPNHPTCVVTAGLDAEVAKQVKEKCPDMDIFGINTYGDIESIPERYRKTNIDKPYIIPEWGINGQWEVAKTPWNAAIEATSKEKAAMYKRRYENIILKDNEMCLGSYVFLWGQKQEVTPTWYSLFTPDGKEAETVDMMQYLWSGKYPENRSPALDSFKLNGKKSQDDIYLNANERYIAEAFISDADGGKIKYVWELLPESSDLKTGGDVEVKPDAIYGLFKKRQGNKLELNAPEKEGGYRLFIYACDEHNNFAVANIPFYVTPSEGKINKVKLKTYNLDSFKE